MSLWVDSPESVLFQHPGVPHLGDNLQTHLETALLLLLVVFLVEGGSEKLQFSTLGCGFIALLPLS